MNSQKNHFLKWRIMSLHKSILRHLQKIMWIHGKTIFLKWRIMLLHKSIIRHLQKIMWIHRKTIFRKWLIMSNYSPFAYVIKLFIMKIFNKKSHLTQTVDLKLTTRSYENILLLSSNRVSPHDRFTSYRMDWIKLYWTQCKYL